ncbi:hypothetical protein B0T26DRAFT_681439 [Lasiosphaeria miniovina]|uniref:Uncharacterized protein n=1 Tax=Lasiosphaeria miniovina TaxID=1954250 RepID=A0AA39ZUJ4_9PEZI|nr:uncharacterized protein B0T26DRAFT_681439 [Lasiosphaeria miniovina]KAK0703811.1 hypothetical protein B0T26DRAFT_681439 [Lasiosphaeria miniovina]
MSYPVFRFGRAHSAVGILGWSLPSGYPGQPFPYRVGKILFGRRHTPPKAAENYHFQEDISVCPGLADNIKNKHILDMCLEHPPAPGITQGGLPITPPDNNSPRAFLAGDASSESAGKQLPPSYLPTNGLLAAKLYDPLFFGLASDPFYACDAAYAHEVKAYKQLEPLWGTTLPRFHGSYTFDVSLVGKDVKTGSVRAIIYEFVPGTVLGSLDENPGALRLSDRQRKAIIANIIDADSQMWQLDVDKYDLKPTISFPGSFMWFVN